MPTTVNPYRHAWIMETLEADLARLSALRDRATGRFAPLRARLDA